MQTVINKLSATEILPADTNIKHKMFGEGVIEEADKFTKTYYSAFDRHKTDTF